MLLRTKKQVAWVEPKSEITLINNVSPLTVPQCSANVASVEQQRRASI